MRFQACSRWWHVGLYPCFRLEWNRAFEYWDRFICGPIYVLRYPKLKKGEK